MAKQGERPVLVADGDDAFRERVVNVLRRAGLSAAGARGGEEALELAASRLLSMAAAGWNRGMPRCVTR